MSALEGSGGECEVVMHRAADGTVTAEWKNRGRGSWVKASAEAVDAMVDEANKAVEMRSLIRRFTAPELCTYDHDDWCQTHGFESPCPHERAQKLIAEWGTS